MTKTQYNIYKKIKNDNYDGLIVKTNIKFMEDDYKENIGYNCYCFGLSIIIRNGTYYQAMMHTIIDWDDKGDFWFD